MESASQGLATGVIPVAGQSETAESAGGFTAQADPVSIAIDPAPALTVALRIIEKALDLGIKVYDDTPKEVRAANAASWGKFATNILDSIVDIQEKIKGLFQRKEG